MQPDAPIKHVMLSLPPPHKEGIEGIIILRLKRLVFVAKALWQALHKNTFTT
jgi:hypothetical protein